MYNLHKRASDLGINCLLKNNITWKNVEFKIDEMNNCVDDDTQFYPKVNSYGDLNKINYQLCIDRIIECCKMRIRCEKHREKILLFSFDIDEYCPLTNYLYLTIFFGAKDTDSNFCFKNFQHIFKYLHNGDNLKYNTNAFYFEIQNKDKIHFELFLV